jgi:hypothetical protein
MGAAPGGCEGEGGVGVGNENDHSLECGKDKALRVNRRGKKAQARREKSI